MRVDLPVRLVGDQPSAEIPTLGAVVDESNPLLAGIRCTRPLVLDVGDLQPGADVGSLHLRLHKPEPLNKIIQQGKYGKLHDSMQPSGRHDLITSECRQSEQG